MSLVTPKGIMLTRKEFDALPEYSMSLPTGTTIGKKWKRLYNPSGGEKQWFLGEYVASSIPGEIGIEWTPIILPPSLEVTEVTGVIAEHGTK